MRFLQHRRHDKLAFSIVRTFSDFGVHNRYNSWTCGRDEFLD